MSDPAAAHRGAGPAFAGRSRELERLSAVLREVLDGSGHLVLLAGEPGIGKTRLAEELARRAREHGANVVWGRCWEEEGAPELWPWLQVIRSCVRAVDEDTLRALVGPHGSELTALLAPLGAAGAGGEATPGSPAARFRLFNAIAHFLDAYAARAPLLVLLDDLHRADAASLLLLQFFTQEQRQRRILMLGTYREPGGTPNRALTHTVVEALREPGSERLTLSALAPAECAALLSGWLGGRPSAPLVEALSARSGGNPLFLTECARPLLAYEASSAPDAADLPLPDVVRELIAQRLTPLTVEARALLSTAARLGRDFRREALAESGDAAAALAAAEQLGLLQRGADAGVWRFAHGVVRELLAAETAAPRAAPAMPPAAPAADAARRVAGGEFRKEGEYWTITFAGRTCRVRDAKGLAYVALLLRHPGTPIHVSELVHLEAGAEIGALSPGGRDDAAPVRVGLGDAGVVLDAQAKGEYRRRLDDLRAELLQAQADHDPGRVERAQQEIDFLTQELAAAVGLGGRDRRVGSDAERARVNVTRSIARAVEKMGENHPELARHLTHSIKTGTYCTYQPDAAAPADWSM